MPPGCPSGWAAPTVRAPRRAARLVPRRESVGEAASLLELLRRLGTGAARPVLPGDHRHRPPSSSRGALARALHPPVRAGRRAARIEGGSSTIGGPDLAGSGPSELWPATLAATSARGIPMLLINARSAAQLPALAAVARHGAGAAARFDRIPAQDDLAGEQLVALGADPARVSR